MDKEERLKLMVESGIITIDFPVFHGYAEALLGIEIWTHEFAMDDINLDLKIAQILKDEGWKLNRSKRTKSPLETLKKFVPENKTLTLENE
jgi:hypothetical protein